MKKLIRVMRFWAALFALPVVTAIPLIAAPIETTASVDDQLSSPSIHAPEPQFTKVIDDLPLMPGLQLVEDEDVLFATGSGRIAETNAIGPVDIEQVYAFYKKSLPHLGWKTLNTHTYEREGEQLQIDAHANNKITLVQFSVKPIGAK